MVVVVSGSGTIGVGGLAGTVVVIGGSGSGAKFVGGLAGTVVVVRKKCRGGSGSSGCWNRYRVNTGRRIDRVAGGIIGRVASCCCFCQ